MLTHLGFVWIALAVCSVSIIGFIFSLGLNAILNKDGFGPIGNTVLIVLGFFGTIYLSNRQGIIFYEFQLAVLYGLAGALGLVGGLVIMKAIVSRI